MCCFSGPVDSVAATNIFARLSGRGTQYLVYQMRYQAPRPVAMILPLPVALPAREDAVRFIDLKAYPDFFEDMTSAFPPPPQPVSIGCARMETLSAGGLRVEQVGDFVASFVPTLDDFKRLDPRFVLPRAVWDQIPAYRDYGFAVFQLRAPSGRPNTPHPMAFEFPTRMPRSLFFPTVHIHDGQVHEREHFDHALYLQGTGPHGDASTGPAAQFLDAERAQGVLLPDAGLRRVLLRGRLRNEDIILSTFGDAGKLVAPGAAVLAAVLLGRRLLRRRATP